MDDRHRNAFFTVADQLKCWIGLREPNPLSERWIGRSGHVPKPLTCKAKTADNPASPVAGLVVSPLLCPSAFLQDSIQAAGRTWSQKFVFGGLPPAGYTIVDSGVDRGLVLLDGARIFADYDLMALVLADGSSGMRFTTEADAARLAAVAIPRLNALLGLPMVQHGTEFQWAGGVGARELEYVLWFGPGQRFRRDLSSMPAQGH